MRSGSRRIVIHRPTEEHGLTRKRQHDMRHTVLIVTGAAILTPLLLRGQQAPAPQMPTAGPGGGRGAPLTLNFDDHAGFTQIFDGKTLAGWEGASDIWSVQDGAIVGLSCPDKPAGTTFVFYKGSEPSDFELKIEMKLQNGNTGIQYRSRNVEPQAGGLPGRGRGPGGGGAPG